MEENLAIFDFELTDDEVKKLSDISQSMTGPSALQRNQHTHFFLVEAGYIYQSLRVAPWQLVEKHMRL